MVIMMEKEHENPGSENNIIYQWAVIEELSLHTPYNDISNIIEAQNRTTINNYMNLRSIEKDLKKAGKSYKKD